MQIKRYEARSIQEALVKIKNDLGDDAVILSTKRLRGGRLPLLEVTAARDDGEGKSSVHQSNEKPNDEITGRSEFDVIKGELEEVKSLILALRKEEPLRRELKQLKDYVTNLADVLGTWEKNLYPGAPSKIYYRLVSNGVSRERAYSLVKRIDTMDSFDNSVKSLEEAITRSIPVANKKKRKGIIAFVGPTGVGKTTTLAKLAAQYSMSEKLGVGLISADTYRIAAAEQLKTYARIMGLPIKVVSEKEDFRNALRQFSDKELILVDTPGKGRNESGYTEKLRDFLSVGVPVETNLLLSVTASRENMLDTASRFSIINYDNIIFTKVDEATGFGAMYDVIEHVGKPVSYLTHGQNVPNDIEEAKPHKIAGLIMCQSSLQDVKRIQNLS
ncbi:MAG: flagellar biosynthesis protein FlhF [Syntrophaceae bacterium]|nr:flagellar biosynthesis protein FlhF [Syntrophaceae bacterium]